MNTDYKTIIFDFDGVLCHDHFYTNVKVPYPAVYDFINTKVFSKGSDVPDKWMRGKLTADDVNKFICDNTGIDFDELSNLFIESVHAMKIDNRLLNLAKTILSKGGKVALVTNNMDVMNKITIKNHNLENIFPVIVNSCDYGILKHDDNGRLFDIAMRKLGISSYKEALLIDDSLKARTTFESKGGATFPYKSYEQFEPWMKENLYQ